MVTTTKSAGATRISPRLLLAAVLAALALLAALAPASAMAQDGGGGGDCTAEVSSTQDPRVAAIDVDCGDSDIDTVRIDPSDQGSIEGNAGTTCEEVGNDVYECRPDDGGSLVSVQFNDEVGDVCADPRLTVDFEIQLADGGTDTIDDAEVQGCSDESGGGDEDGGNTPEGGVDSGAGATADRSSAGATTFPVAGAVLIMLAAGLVFRKTHSTR